ncbi:hypothetical protein A4H97_21945 [Niastella yeongjuensis]|uniref:DUF3828 domain-containing protein n=1 Tax=Niastella yeongjuensis TaxID=354355 RepID=A0A1V9F896_9BACT|nr:hypothetical protein [Niastella yeongjuensis]OQP54629.1 hypothetical protein A4H97_21945 [Niastella yeongjuensis]SEO01524.1 hypothetical protein SAMN05660816_01904 [Niastella yeongjuensis]
MKLQTNLAICTWVLLSACASADKPNLPAIGNNVALNAAPPADEAFKKQPAGTILNFLQWYRSNVTELKKIELVKHSSNPDSAKYYVVDADGTEKFLGALQQSGFVSDGYLNKWRAYFRKCNDNLRKTPTTEAPVQGLDFDLVMMAKDYEEDLKGIEKSTVENVKVANDEGSITLGLPTVGRLKYWISKQDGKWLIEDIKDMRSALDQAQND